MINSDFWHERAAFTLLEVMIAVSIIAISLTTLLGSQSKSLSLAVEAKFNTTAVFLAASKLAEIEAGNGGSVAETGDFGEAFPGYTYAITARKMDAHEVEPLLGLEESILQVDLSVLWRDVFEYQVRYYKLL